MGRRIQWMQDMMPHWRSCNNFKFHLYWHKALMHLGKTDYEPALAVYDDYLAGALGDDFYLDACNAASLLWRLKWQGWLPVIVGNGFTRYRSAG